MRHNKSLHTIQFASTFIVLLLFSTITVSAQPILPVANFSTDVTSGYSPFTVQFNDSSENATGWNWDFGDGSNSTEQNPIHTYLTTGNYTVNLTVTYTNTATKIVTIVVSAQPILPVANFSTDVTSGYAPLTVQVNDSSENATVWNWDFGDGSNSTEQNPLHIYTESGNYTVNLTVSNENGTNSMASTIAVLPENETTNGPIHGPSINDTGLPVANFSTDITSGDEPLTVQFNDSSENATLWNWDFGDGSNSTEQNTIHIYSVAGDYTVNLTVSNENGTDSTTSTITVLPKKTESLNGTIEWGPSIKYDTGGPNSLAMDNSGHCVETHVGTGKLFYRVGNVNFDNNTINWGPSIKFDTGGPDAISMDNSGHCIETHAGSGSLFYRVGNVNFDNNTINWGNSTKFDTGGPDAISMDNSGHCVETHVGDARLFYRVGSVNFDNNTINWGPSIKFDTGGPDTISLDNSGRCIEAHVGTGTLFYRVGSVNFTNSTIDWGTSTKYDTGGPNSISMDNSGHFVEAHVGTARLFYRVGSVNFTNNTINWGKSIKYDTGGPNAISLDNSGRCIEAHVGTARLFYRVGKVNF